ncbi:TFIIH basal transcription factor complex p47 subunit [Grifola frondosa]|uniref:TFIIH basal transcription factor complex p47 subunit n=1 Tax=Grifola frondosa TaxID=5627 RepID=A0A1C7LTB7_GRIFR|nr:TFIIH basal transcription factor complex p47 subunit [Grifola frondosa]
MTSDNSPSNPQSSNTTLVSARAQPYAWEATYTRSWDTVQEDEAGSLQGAVEDLVARGRRRRLLAPAAAIRRTIIRHLVLLLDLSSAMMDRDMRPTRFDLMLQYSREFITEWFDQNPLGQIGIVGMRSGIGERIQEMSGNPQEVLKAISERHKLEPNGEPSLQNAIEMARSSMSHLPTHSSREILIVFGSLTTCDPGNIHETLHECVKDRIRISIVALAAEMKICRDLCEKTGGQFGVAMNEGHFKDLLFELIPPPAQRVVARAGGGAPANPAADLMMMGFPMRLPDTSPPALCVCHSQLKSEGFLCPRCLAKVCDVPTDCDICGLMIVSSPHLARSYHHLFPVKPYQPVMSLADATASNASCHGCAIAFKDAPSTMTGSTMADKRNNIQTSVNAVSATTARPPYNPDGRERQSLINSGTPRANIAPSAKSTNGTQANNWASDHSNQTVLQQHCEFFDSDGDGVVWPLNTYRGFRNLGFNILFAILAAFITHTSFSYPTAPTIIPDPFFRLYLQNIHKAKHGSDTGTYDNEGRFIPQKFEDFFSKYGGDKDGVTKRDIWNGLKGQRVIMDPIGWFGAFFEWAATYIMLWPEDGVLKKEDVRRVYDGSIFADIASKRAGKNKKRAAAGRA